MKTKSILSSYGFCLNEEYLNVLKNDARQQIYEGLLTSSNSSLSHKRVFYLVQIKDVSYWANTVTGSLFNIDGKCMTSRILRILEQPIPIQFSVAA